MREMRMPFYGAEELDNMTSEALHGLLNRSRTVRAQIDGFEALLLAALDRATVRDRNHQPEPDARDNDPSAASPDAGDPDPGEPDTDDAVCSDEEADDVTPPVSRRAQREAEERARRLSTHPEVAAALADGRINTEQADSITKACLPADVKATLLADAYTQTADETRAAVTKALKEADADNAEKRLKRQRKARRGSCGSGDDDMIWINARFDPVTGAAIKAEYDRRERAAYHHDMRTVAQPGDRRTHAQRGADVLASMILDGILPAEAANAHTTGRSGDRAGAGGQLTIVDDPASDAGAEIDADADLDPFERVRPTLNLILTPDAIDNPDDPDAAAYTLDGAPVPARLAADIICTAQINAWTLSADRSLLDLGYDVDFATPEQKLALTIRDQTCRWKGCNHEASRCEAHHLQHREHAGRSDLDNFALLCPYHHDRLHQAKLWLRMDETADDWQLVDAHGQVVDRWSKPAPPWAHTKRPDDDGDADAA